MLDSLVTENAYGFMLIFVRIGTVLALLPGFSAGYVPIRVRLVLALAIVLALTPLLAERLPPMPSSWLGLGTLVIEEFLIGALIGTIARIAFAALHVAGTFAAYFMSLTSALVQDPVVEQQSSTLSGFLTTLGLTLIFVTGLDHVMLRSLIDSYGLFPPATMPPLGDANSLIVGMVGQAFAIGLQLSMPSLIVGLVCNIVLGLLGRLMPQLSVFFFGLPIQLSIQLWVTVLTISAILLFFTKYLSETLQGLIA